MRGDVLLRNAIKSARDVREAGDACRKASKALGFAYFLYGLRIAVTPSRPCQFVLSGYPKGWRSHYDEQGLMMVDPVLARAASTVTPFGWDELDRSTPAAEKLFSEAASFGLKHGLTIPLHGISGEIGIMNLSRREPLPTGAARAKLFQRAQWITSLIQDRMRELVLANENAPKPSLSARERDCLRFAAQGMTSNSIAKQLGIAESTVAFHLNSAERKLGVRTRSHAIARAMALGALDPEEGFPEKISTSEQFIDLAEA